MKRISLFLFLSAVSQVSSCKREETTKAPLARMKPTKKAAMAASGRSTNASAASDEKKPLVSEIKDVPLDEMPRVTVDIDLSSCMGVGRWIDPKTPATPRVGAVSVDLSTSMAGEPQPDPWVYAPIVNTGSDGVIQAKGNHAWRLNKAAAYAINVIAYNVQSSVVESKLFSKIDFKASNDVTLKIVGNWGLSQVCVLSWK